MTIGDLGLFDISYNSIDMKVEKNDLVVDSGLKTAVILSLFTDQRVESDELPVGESSRRGFWADELSEVQNDKHGSKLWLLMREKQTQSVAERAREYCQEALAWLIEDGIAEKVNVTTSFPSRGMLGIAVEIYRPGGDRSEFKFDYLWSGVIGG